MSTVPTPITIYHQVWNDNGALDAHNNPIESYDAPVARKAQAINEFGRRGSSHEILSPDYLERVSSVLEVGVTDPDLYNPRDLVIVGATGVDDDGNPVGGTTFHVQGNPSDSRGGPFPLLNKMLGGSVRIRRVT